MGRLYRVQVLRGSSRKLGLGWRRASSGGLECPESTVGELDGQRNGPRQGGSVYGMGRGGGRQEGGRQEEMLAKE